MAMKHQDHQDLHPDVVWSDRFHMFPRYNAWLGQSMPWILHAYKRYCMVLLLFAVAVVVIVIVDVVVAVIDRADVMFF